MTLVLKEDRHTTTQRHKEKFLCRQTEIRVMPLQGEELLGLLEAGRNKNGSAPRGFRESTALPTPGF